ncbi:MAG: Transcriptional regulator [Pseudomonadota bacterium]|jgi:AcrR family transcriptional regulator
MASTKKSKAATGVAARRKGSRASRRRVAELELRRTPMQARGHATFEGILDATAGLLDDVGGDKVTTNLIARAAGINVATLYQYFPNKQAVLLELFKRQSEARIQLGKSRIAGASGADDWRRIIGNAVQSVAQARAAMPGTVALRQAMRSSPELLEHEQLYSQHMAAALAAELQAVGVKRDRAMLVARCAVETLTALLDLWSIETSGRDDRVIDEAKALIVAYLAPYFDKGSRRGVFARKRR